MSVAGTETNGLTLLSSRRPVHDVVQLTTHNINPTKKKVTMVPPIRRLLAAPTLQVSVIDVRRAIDHDHCNPAMGLLSIKLTNSLFY